MSSLADKRGMERILIIGGAGFIGSRLARKFIERDYEVAVLDSFQHFVSPLDIDYSAVLAKRFEGIRDRVHMLRGDARYKDDLSHAVDDFRPERIIHLAALPISKMSNVHIEEALASTVTSTANILQVVAGRDFVKRFVYTYSSMVYGNFQYVPCDEQHPRNPNGIYGGVKLAGEDITRSFGNRFGISWSIVRPSAVYGPNDINGRVSQIFLDGARSGDLLHVKGGDATKLDFTFVDDTAEGMFLIATRDAAHQEVFNITRGEGRSLMEYVEILRRFFPDLVVEIEEHDKDMPLRGALDIEKARTLLGYEPRYRLEDGIIEYLESYNPQRQRMTG